MRDYYCKVGKEEGYDFQLLADFWPHGAVAKEYGVFLEEKGFANRATFLIDPNGIIGAGRYGVWPKHLREGNENA